MANRFTQMRHDLAELDARRAHGRRSASASVGTGAGPRARTPASARRAVSRPMSVTDRALVILLENGGVDLGIGEFVDKLLALSSIGSLVPRQALVNFIDTKVRELTDNALESIELGVNRYASSRPEFYGDVTILRNGTAVYSELRDTLVRLSGEGKLIDLYILTHGGTDSIAAFQGQTITGRMIRDIKGANQGRPVRLRSVYMMNCVGSSLNRAWRDIGARVSSGSVANNYIPEPTMFFFFRNWKGGQSFQDAATNAYRSSIQAINAVIRAAADSLLPAGMGSVIESLADIANADFVRDSAPVFDGDGSVTIASDALSFSASAPSLAYSIVPLGRSLTGPVARTRSWSVSQAGVDFIKSWESFQPNLYNDPAGHCTVGYGTLVHRGACNGDPSEAPYASGISEAEATRLLRERLAEFERTVNEAVTTELTDAQYDALVSFAYNVGSGNFRGSTLLRRLNEGHYDDVPSELRKWVNAGGRRLPGLVRRRDAEAQMFSRGTYANNQSIGARAFTVAPGGAGDPLAATEEGEMEDPGATGVQMSGELPAYCPVNAADDAATAHFSLREFASKDGAETPRSARGNIQILMEQLEELRSAVGQPIRIVSGYRSPAHNAKVGGKGQSQHMCGTAADIKIAEMTPRQVYDKIEELIAAGRMRQGGLGLYNTFVHYDTRGRRARW